ncbi:MAG: flavodoxin [Deltaproteobacteria bacterium]|jgi:flavodoxin short chain|nr:flavodoxin [Deltaproteobacteria bacterium]
MSKALIVYGSTTGNTEYAAGVVERALKEAGFSIDNLPVTEVRAPGLCDGYELAVFGCSTWGDDSIELQDDFIPLFDSFEQIKAEGKKVAVFGCGMSGYTYFCGAVDAISQKLSDLGANVLDTLKIDGDPQSSEAEIESWAGQVAAKAS